MPDSFKNLVSNRFQKSTMANQIRSSLVIEFANEVIRQFWGKKGAEQAKAISLKRQIIKILFGSEYIPGYIPLIILAASYFIYHIFNISAQTLKVLKKSKHLMINLAIAAVVNIILSYWLIPRTDSFGGIVGGAISTSVSLLIYGFLCGIQSYYFTKISPFQIKQIKTIFVGAVTFTIVYYLFTMIEQRTVFNLSALFILFLFLYVSFILIFRCLNKEDYEILKDVKNRIKSLLKF